MDRVEILEAGQGLGDLRHAVALGIEQHDLEPAPPSAIRAQVLHQPLVALDAGVHEDDLAARERGDLAGLCAVLEHLELRGGILGPLVLGEVGVDQHGLDVRRHQQAPLQLFDERA